MTRVKPLAYRNNMNPVELQSSDRKKLIFGISGEAGRAIY